jgi:excisionase family DNA binding protein
MVRNQFSKWNSTKVKARADYTCVECGSTENIQAHDPTGSHKDWRQGVCLCGECHSKKHPELPPSLFAVKTHQPYWPNISARSLANEIGCHNRTIIRIANQLGIKSGIPLSNSDRNLIASYYSRINGPDTDILSVKQIATIFGIHYRTVLHLINNGLLRAYKPGGNHKGNTRAWHIRQTDLDLFLKARRL